jgi:2-isopropylmalate synthase
VGRNAFRHASGIHQDGVIKWRENYELIDPRIIGHPTGTEIVLGKLSGRAGFAARARALGFQLDGDRLDQAFARFQRHADRSREVGDEELRGILATVREAGQDPMLGERLRPALPGREHGVS